MIINYFHMCKVWGKGATSIEKALQLKGARDQEKGLSSSKAPQRNYHYLTLYVYQLMEAGEEGMLRDGSATVCVKKELVSFVYCAPLFNKESA